MSSRPRRSEAPGRTPSSPTPGAPPIRPRRRSRLAFLRDYAALLQRGRLACIARGEAEPLCERERLFLAALQIDGRADLADYVVPLPLLLAETEREARPSAADRVAAPPDAAPDAPSA